MNKKPVVGGQAVIEGVMMRNGLQMSMAVRQPDGEIVVEKKELSSLARKYPLLKLPIFRGAVILGEAMVYGMRALSDSARISGESDEEFSDSELAMTIVAAIFFSVALFIVLPTYAVKFLHSLTANALVLNLAEGLLRLGIFLAYVAAIARMKEIERVFEYHGAEHKTIHAYEAGVPLDVEHVRAYTTLHPRCGTSFLLVVMVVSLIVFTFTGWPSLVERIASRLILMPVIAGISYEFIRYAGAHAQQPSMRWLVVPGLFLQKFTTREPDDQQLEVAIAALEAVLPNEGEPLEELPEFIQ